MNEYVLFLIKKTSLACLIETSADLFNYQNNFHFSSKVHQIRELEACQRTSSSNFHQGFYVSHQTAAVPSIDYLYSFCRDVPPPNYMAKPFYYDTKQLLEQSAFSRVQCFQRMDAIISYTSIV